MASRVKELEAEIARLRAVCEEFDIDPDWQPPKMVFGPPTPHEHLWLTELVRMAADALNDSILADVADSQPCAIRVEMPVDWVKSVRRPRPKIPLTPPPP